MRGRTGAGLKRIILVISRLQVRRERRWPFNPNAVGDADLVAHEGSHVANGFAWIAPGFSLNMNPAGMQN